MTPVAVGVRSVWHVCADTLVGLIPLDGHDVQFVLDRLGPPARGRAAAVSTSRVLADVGLTHGATGALFLQTLVALLENPLRILA
jgi:hypothetical protein